MSLLKFNKSELVNLEYSLKREIILANKTGAYCNTSIVTCNTRRYHALLAVPVDALGGGKHALLSSLDESLIVNGRQFNLGIHCYGDVYEPRGHKYIVDFTQNPYPEVIYKVGEIVFSKTIILVPDSDQLLIKYSLIESPAKAAVQLKPFLAFRRTHALTHQNTNARTGAEDIEGGVSFCLYPEFPDLNLQMSCPATFRSIPDWYNGVTYSDEYRRGFDCKEDLFVPGYFQFELKKGESVVFSASVNEEKPKGLKRKFTNIINKAEPLDTYHDVLVHNADVLISTRNDKHQITAGFSWLSRGLLRETIMALPGLTLYADGNKEEFEAILDTLIADNEERLYRRTTQVESPLRLADTLQQYIDFTGEEKRIWKKYGPVMKGIIESYAPGVRKEVTLHPNGLLWAQMDGVALSWMNAYINGRAVTERAGYQVETNAWWYNALCFAIDMEIKYGPAKNDFVKKWTPVRDNCKANYQNTFWNEEWGYLSDYVDNNGQHAEVRPNMIIPAYVKYSPIDDDVMSSVILTVNSELRTKRGLRTLSPRNVNYRGVYEGSQLERDLAYHQGTTRPQLLGEYFDVCFKMIGSNFVKKAEYLVEGFQEDLSKHGVGAISELYDGDPPHTAHGAISSACATAALLRCEYLINKYKEVK